MLENVLTNLQDEARKIKSFARRNKQKLASFMVTSKMASVFAIALVIPMISPDSGSTYQSDIRFDEKSPTPLIRDQKKINIIAAPSRADIKNTNWSLNPEAIKSLIQQMAPEYGIDWKFVYAIGSYESANFNSSLARRNFNFFGRKARTGVWASWDNPEQAVRDQFVYLRTRYFDRGLDTPAEIGPIYCEGDTWASKITSIMAKL